jgi:hypothetical protein
MLCNSLGSKDSARTYSSLNNNVQIRKTNFQNAANMADCRKDKLHASAVAHSSAPFSRRVTDAVVQPVHSKSTLYKQNVSDSPQVQARKLSYHENFKFQPQPTPASSGRKVSDSRHQSDERKTVGSESFRFQPQPTPPLNCNRTDTVIPTFKGGFIPKVSRFGSSAAAGSQASYFSQVPAVAGTSFDVSDSRTASKPTANIVDRSQETLTLSMPLNLGGGSSVTSASGQYSSSERTSKSSECTLQVESSALDVLDGLDTNSLFDEF